MSMKKMKHGLVGIIGLALAIGLISCNQPAEQNSEVSVAYFRHMLFSETPYDALKGTYPLTSDEAQNINHYRFTYNEDGSLKSVAYMRADELLGYSSLGAAKIVITYENGTEIQHFFNKDGEPQELGGVFSRVYELDDDGNRVGLSFYDQDGNLVENRNNIAYYVWNVMDDGMVQEKRYNLKDEETVMNPFCPFYELRFSYDENGYAVRMANYMGDTLYDCTVENCGDVGVSYFSFENNEHGGLQQFSVHNTVGQLSNLYWGWAKFKNTLDEYGNIIESVYFDQDDEYLAGNNLPVNQYVYDEHGAVIERRYLNADKEVTEHPNSGIAILKYAYDKHGHPTDTLRLNAAMEEI